MGDGPIPVTVIGGYLGAGKTTLLNRLLRADRGERVAVLVNDFGSVAVDAALIESADGTTIRLSNGCICCTMAGGFVEAIESIGALDPRPDRLVVETSGVADPASVAEYAHLPGFVLDAVVVLADAETIRERAADALVGRQVREQLAGADVVVLNKVDLVAGRNALDAVVTWAAAAAPQAHLVTAVEADVDAAVLWADGSRVRIDPGVTEHAPDHAHAGGDDRHPRYLALTVTGERAPTRLELDAVLDEVLDEVLDGAVPAVVRLKGFVDLVDGGRHLVQVVGRRRRITRVVAATVTAGDVGRDRVALVVIGLADSPSATSVAEAAMRIAHGLGARVVEHT